MGIKISKFSLEKSLEDYKFTLERIAMAAKWDKETISVWERKGWSAHAVLRKPRRERLRRPGYVMEAERDKLVVLEEMMQYEAEERSHMSSSIWETSCVQQGERVKHG